MSEVNSNSATAIENLDLAHTWTDNLDICQSFHGPKNEKLAVA